MQKFLNVLIGIGIPSIIGGLIYIGMKLQILNSMEKTIEKMKGNIAMIAGCLSADPNIDFDSSRLHTYSPLRLTEKGEKYLETVGFVKVFREHPELFFNFIDNENPTVKFDVETGAYKAFMFLLGMSDEHLKPLKIYAFNNPSEDLREIAKYASVYVRDKYLEKHPEIDE